MDPSAHRSFTLRLRDELARDPRVIGLVGQGSTSAAGRTPDEWSDHDFFVVVARGEGPAIRGVSSWLPDAARVVLLVDDPPHGRRAVWDDGHVAEYAVFESDELALARSEPDYEILLDRGGVAEAMRAVAASTAAGLPSAAEPGGGADPRSHAGRFVALVPIVAGRWRRGERLSARALLSAAVTYHLVPLLARASVPPGGADGTPPPLDATRRFEARHPALGAELDHALALAADAAALALLDLAERELARNLPEFPSAAAAAVRRRIAAAGGARFTGRPAP